MTKRTARILAVDDDPAMLRMIRELLGKEKFSVTTADGGREGMKRFNRTPFDLVLLDIDMPEVSGFEVLTHIRPRSPDVKVIMVTGLDDLKHGMRAMESGANGYITKPFNIQDFVDEVKRVLED
ncbi:MAG: response regulator [Bacteroidota bacterium]